MLHKVVYAGAHARSFAQASKDLGVLAELKVPTKQVERLTAQIGRERQAERDTQAEQYAALPLAEKDRSPSEQIPEVAVIQYDGGRLQILDRSRLPSASSGPEAGGLEAHEEQGAASQASAEGEESAEKLPGHWREDKVGTLMTMASKVQAADPCPEIPETFVDPLKILKITREISEQEASGVLVEKEEPAASEASGGPPRPPKRRRPGAPEVLVRTVVASRATSRRFALLLATAAWRRGFPAAARKAFVADGARGNWTLWKRWFSDYVPILDFVHALSYVFAAATAGCPFAEGWSRYLEWIRWLWSGQVELVLQALRGRQAELGQPERGEGESHPRQKLAQAVRYLDFHKQRMRYDEYRRQGLPITSCYIESMIKQINRRVKGTEKFWSEEGAEAILQVRADYLSDTDPLADFWERRQETATGQRRYRRAA